MKFSGKCLDREELKLARMAICHAASRWEIWEYHDFCCYVIQVNFIYEKFHLPLPWYFLLLRMYSLNYKYMYMFHILYHKTCV
jgi:hypothetical protein